MRRNSADRENIFRIWLAGRWRIVYTVDDESIVVLILRVRRKDGHRLRQPVNLTVTRRTGTT